ncbi:MAG TPA: ATP-binding protein [Casimicrobiaceae bacterium]|nr:ATP-binding protein [Casimicrobiaceae bacterium]
MPTLTRHSLFWKYAAYFAGVVSALLVISGAVGGYFAYRESVTALEDVQQAKAQFAAADIESFMRGVQDALHAIVGKFNANGPVALEDLQLELVALLRHHPEVSGVRWIDAGGDERIALSRFDRNVVDAARNWSAEPGFRTARKTSSYVGPIHFRKETEPYVSVAAARDPGGSVLVAEVDLKYVWDVVSQVQLTHDGVAYVVDRAGELISHPDIGLVLRKTDLSTLPQVRRALDRTSQGTLVIAEARDLAGVPVVSTAAPIDSLGWVVFAEEPLDEALRPVYASLERSVALVVLGLIAAIAASILLARRMVRPIREIETRARQIGEGRFDRRIALSTGDELEALAHQFNLMAGRVQDTYAMQETRIAERTRELALANEAKTRFLAAASHDLRQPMHALALFVGQLRGVELPPDATTLLEKIERSVDALNELLEALLDLSKLDVGAISAKRGPLALNDLLSRLASEFAPSAEAKGLALTLAPTSLWADSDPVLLQRILLNVIANALRYTRDGRILIGCRRRGDEAEVIVADTGIGIDAVHLPQVFEEFYTAVPTQAGGNSGLGLGLAIVKRLAALLDHRVSIESTLGKGTLVRIRVPRAKPVEAARPLELPIAEPLRGVRVLIVDDESAARDAMQGLLARWGCDVAAAESGDAAIEHAREQPPDVVLCDLRLRDGETGIDVVDRLKRECRSAAYALVTGESSPEYLAQARTTGDPIAFKPTTPGKLRALLEHLVGAKQAITG